MSEAGTPGSSAVISKASPFSATSTTRSPPRKPRNSGSPGSDGHPASGSRQPPRWKASKARSTSRLRVSNGAQTAGAGAYDDSVPASTGTS